MSTCLSDFALDDLVLNGLDSQPAVVHVNECDACRRRRDERLVLLDDFERGQAESFWREVRLRYARGRTRRWTLALPAAVAFAGAAMLLLLPRARKSESVGDAYRGAKGAAYLQIHCRRAGSTFPLTAKDTVRAGDELRFVPRPALSTAHYVQVASIDGTGRYAPFYPPHHQGESVPLPPRDQALDGSIRLDSAPGPERLFFVFSASPLTVPAVEQAARAQVGRLSPSHAIDGVEVESGWIVLSKSDRERAP
jgi:hypothetical protein